MSGAERPWRAARETQFVLKGDVRGLGAILQDPVAGPSFPEFFAQAVPSPAAISRSPTPATAMRHSWSTRTRARW